MMSSVTAHQLFTRARKRERFVKRRSFADLHDHARDASRGWFFAELTKDPGQLFLAVIVNDRRRCETRLWVHPHIERSVSHQTDPALCVFAFPGLNTQVKKRA